MTGAGPAAGASYTLVGGIILLGGIGYGLDRWQGTAPGVCLSGLMLGLIVGFYESGEDGRLARRLTPLAWMVGASA